MTDLSPIRKSIDVPLPPKEAFALFTERLADWWPVETHSLSAADGGRPSDVVVEPRQGGQIVETLPDGQTKPWARITEWSPGRRFAFDWHVGRDEADATQVDIVFAPNGEGCRVDLTHDGFAGLGEVAMRSHASYLTGWDGVLALFVSAAKDTVVAVRP